jgi:hypothetical protein
LRFLFERISQGGKSRTSDFRSTEKYREVQGSTGKYKEVQGSTVKYREVQRSTEKYKEVQGSTVKYREVQRSTRKYREVQSIILFSKGEKADFCTSLYFFVLLGTSLYFLYFSVLPDTSIGLR